jgi:DegV family protein with EDD domain
MNRIKIVTDSAVHLSPADIHHYQIKVMNPPILIDGKLFGYVNQIKSEKFLQLFEKCSVKPVIGDLSVPELVATYDELGKDGSQILSIHLSDKLTRSYQNATLAAAQSNSDVTVINSEVTAAGLAYQVLAAAKWADQGETVATITDKLTRIKTNTRIFFSVQNNSQLINRKMIGKFRGLFDKQLNVSYILAFLNNDFSFVTRSRKEDLISAFWEKQLAEMHDQPIVRLSILYSGSGDRAQFLYTMLTREFPFVPISIVATNPEMATFIGPESTGVTYLLG